MLQEDNIETNVIKYIDFEEVKQFSEFDQFYAKSANQCTELYDYPADLDGIKNAIEQRKKYSIDRNTLVASIKNNYDELKIKVSDSLINQLVEQNTFTITCAHQPNIFTGPVFFIYKLISTIKLAHQCNDNFPAYNFIPVLYLGSEDHDLQELNHIFLFGKKLTWETNQSGAVGRMKCTEMEQLKSDLFEKLGNSENATELKKIIDLAYLPDHTISQAITIFLHLLLKDFKFLVLNADRPELKALFKKQIVKDITEQRNQELVIEGQKMMFAHHLQSQAHPREINFFYLQNESRDRIIGSNDDFSVVNQDKTWNNQSLREEIEIHPENFSPNVILRPLYQETILPSVAFVGGGGELAYWSDRKLLFNTNEVFFPVLIRRDSFLIIDSNTENKLSKLHLSLEDLLLDDHKIQLQIIQKNSEGTLDLSNEKFQMGEIVNLIIDKAIALDSTLKGYIGSEGNQIEKIILNIESRVLKTQKKRNETLIDQALNLKHKLFPDGELQERKENFMSWYIKYGTRFIYQIYNASNPMNIKMKIIKLD